MKLPRPSRSAATASPASEVLFDDLCHGVTELSEGEFLIAELDGQPADGVV